MTTTELDTYTDYLAHTNVGMFPVAEKLVYYNIAYGLLNSLIIDEQEDNFEEEDTKDTIAGQSDYHEKARIHHLNWLKINYGEGFIPARHKPEAELIAEYGNELETVLTTWDQSNPIYFYKGSSLFVYPAPTAAQAGTGRLKVSMELIPPDLTAGATPLIPVNFHYLLGVYAAEQYHLNNSEDTMAANRERQWAGGVQEMLRTMFPRAREAEVMALVPDDDGSDY